MAAQKKEPQAPATTEPVRPARPQQPPFIMEGRTLENTFTELEREGKACLYELLRAAVGKMPRTFFTQDRRRWNGALHNEQKDLLNRFLCDGGTVVYGSTFQRAKAKWDAEVRTASPRQLTEEERRFVIDMPPDPSTPTVPGGTTYIGAAPERGTTVPLENLFTYWIEEFAAEVENAVEAFSENPSTSTELQRITNALGSFDVGTAGRLILQPMQADAAGKDLWAKFEHAKNRLALRLGERSAGVPASIANGTAERLPWTSSTNAFAHIFTTLSTKGYFPIPRKGGKRNEPNFTGLARVLLQAFDVKGEDGKSLNAEQLRVRLTDAAPRPLAETKKAKFQIPDKGELIVPNAEELEERAR